MAGSVCIYPNWEFRVRKISISESMTAWPTKLKTNRCETSGGIFAGFDDIFRASQMFGCIRHLQ